MLRQGWIGAVLCVVVTACAPTAPACPDGAGCPEGMGCLVDVEVCVVARACLRIEGGVAVREADGTPCDDGICLAGVCEAPRCGDGLVTLSVGERCDGTSGCRADCTRCGDGVLDEVEGCDDGDANDDGAPGACRSDCRPAHCGDGVVDPDEVCDDGEDNDDHAPDACRTDCRPARCGDGVIDAAEGCDDGPANDDLTPDACRNDCQPARCGDNVIDEGEQCDGVVVSSGGVCDPDCVEMVCGNGRVDADIGETCDDVNDNPRDGCDACVATIWQPTLLNPDAFTATRPIGAVREIAVRGGEILLAHGGPDPGMTRVQERPDGPPTAERFAGAGGIDDESLGDGGDPLRVDLDVRNLSVDDDGALLVGTSANVVRIDRESRQVQVIAGGFLRLANNVPARGVSVGTTVGVVRTARGTIAVADSRQVWQIVDGRVDLLYQTTRQLRALRADPLGELVVLEVGIAPTDAAIVRISPFGGATPLDVVGLNDPRDLVVAGAGVYLVANAGRSHVRCIDLAGRNQLIAGRDIPAATQQRSDGDGGPATQANLRLPTVLGVLADGDVLLQEEGSGALRRIDADFRDAGLRFDDADPLGTGCAARVGTISTFLGTADPVDRGDGLPALTATFVEPAAVVVLPDGSLVVADRDDDRLRRIAPDGTISTFFGRPGTPTSGDPGSDGVSGPKALAVHDGVIFGLDRVGLYRLTPDSTGALRRETLFSTSTAVALAVDVDGTVHFGPHVIGGPFLTVSRATDGSISTRDAFETAFAARPEGGIAVASSRQVFAVIDGVATLVAGDGGLQPEAVVDGDPLAVGLGVIRALATTADGSLVIVGDDGFGDRTTIWRVQDGRIDTVAGGVTSADYGDGGPAAEAGLARIVAVAIDGEGGLVIAQHDDNALDRPSPLRRVRPDGAIEAVVHRHRQGHGPLTTAVLPTTAVRLMQEAAGHVVLLPNEAFVSEVRVTTCADGSRRCGRADLGLGRDSTPSPNLPVSATSIFPGTGVMARGADAPLTAYISSFINVFDVDPDDDGVMDDALRWQIVERRQLPVADLAVLATAGERLVGIGDHCVQQFTGDQPDSLIAETVLGRCGSPGSTLDALRNPGDVVFGPGGSLYIADTGNHRVLRVRPDGVIESVIGDGSASNAGVVERDARTLPIRGPSSLASDRFGNLIVAAGTHVRMIVNRGDGDALDTIEADGSDGVITLMGDPEGQASCLDAVAVVDDARDPDDGRVYVADVCRGALHALDLTPP